MRQRYCYWSVCDGPYAALMEQCVASARRAGVCKEFHVLTDRPVEGCECYDAQTLDKADGLFKLVYLKAGISKLLFDYFVWIDADSWFTRSPWDLLGCLGKAPMHLTLATPVSALPQDQRVHEDGWTAEQYRERMMKAGVFNPVYLSVPSFWIVHHDVIDRVCDLAQHFGRTAKQEGFRYEFNAAISYAAQMLCGDPAEHCWNRRPDLWASDDAGYFKDRNPDGSAWPVKNAFTEEETLANPAIIHLPHRKPQTIPVPTPASESETVSATVPQA